MVAEVEDFAEQLRKVLCEVFVRLDNEWSTAANLAGMLYVWQDRIRFQWEPDREEDNLRLSCAVGSYE